MTGADRDAIPECCRSHAADPGRRFQELETEEFLAPVFAHLPDPPSHILDIGAGSGRDAAWFATRGHPVVAVEPVADLAAQARVLEGNARVERITDALPDLAALEGREGDFDLAWLCAVWHHLDTGMRSDTLARIAAPPKPGGRLIVSSRHSPDVDGRLTFEADPAPAIALAEAAGSRLVHRKGASSARTHNEAPGIGWCPLVFDHEGDL